MLAGRLLGRAGIVAGCGALVLTAGLGPARGGAASPARPASAPGWQLTATVGPADGSTALAALVVTGRHDAWVAANACDVPSSCQPDDDVPVVAHWDGSQWSRVPLNQPPDFRHLAGFGAASRTDAWAFTEVGREALHWNGKAWAAQLVPRWVVRTGGHGPDNVIPAVFGPSDVLVFSLASGRYAARYNGRHWTRLALPASPLNVLAKSPRDIWLQADQPVGRTEFAGILHWNGRAWARLAVPRVMVPAGAQETLFLAGVAGPRDLWLLRAIQTSSALRPLYWQHWNGKSWSRLYPPRSVTAVGDLIPDGHGGFWTAATGAAPGYRSYFLHRAHGRWSWHLMTAAEPLQAGPVQYAAQVPGTRTLLAAGVATVTGGSSAGGPFAGLWQYFP